MSTNPGYQQIQAEGEGNDAPPPAFNPDAVNPNDYSAPAISYGAIPPQQPQQQQQPIPQQIVQQQAQYNPQQIQYVDQYGQPIQQSQQPIVIVPPQQVQQPTIIYAQQPQNQQQALIPPQPQKPLQDYRHPSQKDRQKRLVATLGGIVATILLVWCNNAII